MDRGATRQSTRMGEFIGAVRKPEAQLKASEIERRSNVSPLGSHFPENLGLLFSLKAVMPSA